MRSWCICLFLALFAASGAAVAEQRRRPVARPAPLPSSAALIDQALASGAINAEQAITYKVFADFGDARLPAAFRGDDSGAFELESPQAAGQQWASLPAAVKDVIGPYLVPAFYDGSWWSLRHPSATSVRPLACKPWEVTSGCSILGEWNFKAGKYVRVWYDNSNPGDSLVAADLAHEVDTKIWPEIISVMGRAPILDHEVGGTKLLDVVMTDNMSDKVLATTFSVDFIGCGRNPTWVAFNRNITNRDYSLSVLAHELFHSVQHTYNTAKCVTRDYKWLMESTATWFEDQVYPKVDREHLFAKYYLEKSELAVDTKGGSDASRFYGGYLFFQYLTRFAGGSPYTVVRNIWEATECTPPATSCSSTADQLHALQSGLAKSGLPLETSWPGFATMVWNGGPPFDRYLVDDRLAQKPTLQLSELLQLPTFDKRVELGDSAMTLPHLSIRYFRFDFPDATVSTVSFYNGIQRALHDEEVTWADGFGKALRADAVGDPATIKGAHVDAMLKINGKWTHEDWTDRPFQMYCRDLKAERLESLVIILSNSDIENDELRPQGTFAPILQASNLGCYAWEGTADLRWEEDGKVETMTVRGLRLEAASDVPDAEEKPLRRLFLVTAGTFHWTVSGKTGDCTWSAPDVTEAIARTNLMYTFAYATTPARGARGLLPFFFLEWLTPRLIVAQTGLLCSTTLANWTAGSFVIEFIPTEGYAQFSADGKSFTVDVSKTPFFPTTGTWHLTAKRE